MVIGVLRRGNVREGVPVSVGCGDLLWAQTVTTCVQQRRAAPDDDHVTIKFEASDDDQRLLLEAICTQGATIGVIERGGEAPG